MSSGARVLWVAALASALGSAAGSGVVAWARGGGVHLAHAAPAGAAIEAPAPREDRSSASPPAFDVGMLRADIRAIVHDEVAAAAAGCRPAPPAAASGTPVTSAPALAAGPDLAAERDAQAVVEHALARKVWTDDDARGMRKLLATVTNEQREDLLRQLVPAMNDGRIRVQASGSPF